MTPDFRALRGEGVFSFLRHGESEGNRQGIMQGRIPSRLTQTGQVQARRAGEWFRAHPPTLILTSPLGRAYETAVIVAREAGLDGVTPWDELTEIDTGLFTGLTMEEASARHPQAHLSFQEHSWDGVPGAEAGDALYERALRVWEGLFRRFEEGARSVLCVTHSGFLQWILRATIGLRSWMPLFSTNGNCHITQLQIANRPLDGGRWSHYANWVRVNAPP